MCQDKNNQYADKMEVLWILHGQEKRQGVIGPFVTFKTIAQMCFTTLLLLLLKSKDLCLHLVSKLYLRLSFMMPLSVLVFKKCFFFYPDTVIGVDTI